jgi:metallo-beta-lactamase family protein
MLRDAAMLQDQDARYINKHNQRNGSDERVTPLYDVEDAERAVAQMISLPLHRPMLVAPSVWVTFYDSGHVLGSALVALDIEEAGRRRRLLFTGDLGRAELPLLGSPEVVAGVDALLMESTYGDRDHPSIAAVDAELGRIVATTIGRGGRVYVPTFALERAQEVLFALDRLHERRAIPHVPIYIDSPLAIAITEIYKLHPESLSPDIRQRILEGRDPFSPPGLRYVSQIADSRRLQNDTEPCIIMAGSGMCEGGRILYHFTKALENPKNSVVIVGFMAQHTLGRRLLEGRPRAKVFGLERDVRASVHYLGGLSAHAGQSDLVAFAKATALAGHLDRILLVHGEPAARATLAARLAESSQLTALRPVKGQIVEL